MLPFASGLVPFILTGVGWLGPLEESLPLAMGFPLTGLQVQENVILRSIFSWKTKAYW